MGRSGSGADVCFAIAHLNGRRSDQFRRDDRPLVFLGAAAVYAQGVNIRRATAADEVAMRELWDEFNAQTTYTPYPGSPFAQTLLTDQIALIAEDSGEPVGCVYGRPSDHFGFVFGLYVRPSARRRGIARSLMRAIAEVLRDKGKQYVVLSVDTPNAAARTLYKDLGFIDAARTLRAEIVDLVDPATAREWPIRTPCSEGGRRA